MSEIRRGTHTAGAHYVLKRNGLKLRSKTERKDGPLYSTLTEARKMARQGDCLVRQVDGEVVAVK